MHQSWLYPYGPGRKLTLISYETAGLGTTPHRTIRCNATEQNRNTSPANQSSLHPHVSDYRAGLGELRVGKQVPPAQQSLGLGLVYTSSGVHSPSHRRRPACRSQRRTLLSCLLNHHQDCSQGSTQRAGLWDMHQALC